jgi:hypothetical protein
VRKHLDIRRVPMTFLFLGAAAAIFVYLLRSYLWLFRYNPMDFFLRVVFLVPVVLFFAALATLILWYVVRILLPGLLRLRRLRMIRYQRSLRTRDDKENVSRLH